MLDIFHKANNLISTINIQKNIKTPKYIIMFDVITIHVV